MGPIFPCESVGFIGPGNMCKAIVGGILGNDTFKAEQIYLYGRNIEKVKQVTAFTGCNIVDDIKKVFENCPVIFLSIKPFGLDAISADISKIKDLTKLPKFANKVIISVLAGVTIDRIKAGLPSTLFENRGWRIIRVMPNTPLMVREGAVVYSIDDPEWDIYAIKIMDLLFSGCSGICKMVSESQINAVGAVSGSGPAYAYIMIEALADGGVKMGLARDLAIQLAAQTLLGAAKMVLETGKHPGLLKDEVCSPKGTTIAGVKALEDGKIRHTLMSAVEAAYLRSEELGKEK